MTIKNIETYKKYRRDIPKWYICKECHSEYDVRKNYKCPHCGKFPEK